MNKQQQAVDLVEGFLRVIGGPFFLLTIYNRRPLYSPVSVLTCGLATLSIWLFETFADSFGRGEEIKNAANNDGDPDRG